VPLSTGVQVGPTGTQAPLCRVKPLSQLVAHLPALQVALPFCGEGQALPQAPQLAASLERSTHWPLQSWPLVQVGWQPEGVHTPLAQTVPQAPQLDFDDKSASQPSSGLLEQCTRPEAQLTLQVPWKQVALETPGSLVQSWP